MNIHGQPHAPSPPSRDARRDAAFTLLEVMIAMAIFFMATFAILNLVAQNLRTARSLSLGEVDLGTVAAEIVAATNFSEGTISGDFGDSYPGAQWSADITLVGTNGNTLRSLTSAQGLYQADITIVWPQNGLQKQKKASILIYQGQSSFNQRLRRPPQR